MQPVERVEQRVVPRTIARRSHQEELATRNESIAIRLNDTLRECTHGKIGLRTSQPAVSG